MVTVLTSAQRAVILRAAVELEDYAKVLSDHGDTGMIQLGMALRDIAEGRDFRA